MPLLMILLTLLAIPALAQQKPAGTVEFHGSYEELRPQQKGLIDEWYAECNTMTGDHASPTDYNQFSLSTRTTFEAVTHALMTTTLTGKSGQSLGNALDLVQSIENGLCHRLPITPCCAGGHCKAGLPGRT